jgi:transcriptional regulator with XRE-family HTH domain
VTHDEEVHARRLGYWLRRVRLRRGVTLSSAALAAGLRATSGSTVSLWERGQREMTVQDLRRLAGFYGVPEGFFTHPQKTDEERLSEALAAAEALERQDWEEGSEGGRGGGGGRGDEPSRLH